MACHAPTPNAVPSHGRHRKLAALPALTILSYHTGGGGKGKGVGGGAAGACRGAVVAHAGGAVLQGWE